MPDEPPRSRAARRAAEQALVRVVHHYGAKPEFVVLGGLVPELLCARSEHRHVGTNDVDVQVDEMMVAHPELDAPTLRADAVLTVDRCCALILAD